MKNTALWQLVSGILLSSLITGAASWMAFGRDMVTREEMVQYMQESAPWIRDRAVIQLGISSNSDSIVKLEKAVSRMVQSVQDVVVEQRILISKVDQLLEDGD